MNRFNYEETLEKYINYLSVREQKLMAPIDFSKISKEYVREYLLHNGFVFCNGGEVIMGSDKGLKCSVKGYRKNETPVRATKIPPFYISKTLITNLDYELFDPNHSRTNTSNRDKQPVTTISYGRALSYVSWLNETTSMCFTLPTEPQFVIAASPTGWEYPYQKTGTPQRKKQNVYKSFPELYPENEMAATLDVDDEITPQNYLGLFHITGNVSIFTLGHFYTEGHWGAFTDGAYTVTVGGNFRLCPYSARTISRGIIDVTGIADTFGIRLVHLDPFN